MIHRTQPPLLFGLKRGARIFFVGIGGYSVSGLAQICMSIGFTVSGSDMEISHRTEHLADLGICVFHGHNASHIEDFHPNCVVYSVAVDQSNPELVRAGELGIPVYERSVFLGGLNRLYQRVINISGTHGKTTTTTMCSLILDESGIDHTAHIGAMVDAWKSTVRTSSSRDLFVSEACEYNASFLRFFSTTVVILNIDHDHVDTFPSIEDAIMTFARFADTVSVSGHLIIPSYDPNVTQMIHQLRTMKTQSSGNITQMPDLITFGRESDTFEGKKPTFHIRDYSLLDGYPRFDVYFKDSYLCHINLALPGEYNALNALAAIAAAVINGANGEACSSVLSRFKGADNRFSHRGMYKGIDIISDYAHHPTAITAAFHAAQDITKGKVWAVFQPITFTRAKGLFREFVKALSHCPDAMVVEVYTSRANDSRGFSSKMICDAVNEIGGSCFFINEFEPLKQFIDDHANPGDCVLFMGPEMLEGYADRLVKEASF
jgi:UDP-N-acetylmuramate--alanine ligase